MQNIDVGGPGLKVHGGRHALCSGKKRLLGYREACRAARWLDRGMMAVTAAEGGVQNAVDVDHGSPWDNEGMGGGLRSAVNACTPNDLRGLAG